jgi:hypothetical protein
MFNPRYFLFVWMGITSSCMCAVQSVYEICGVSLESRSVHTVHEKCWNKHKSFGTYFQVWAHLIFKGKDEW